MSWRSCRRGRSSRARRVGLPCIGERLFVDVSAEARRARADGARVDEKWLVAGRASAIGCASRRRPSSRVRLGLEPRDFNNILKLARDSLPRAADYDRASTARACVR